MFAKQKNKHSKACTPKCSPNTQYSMYKKKLKKTYFRQFIWLTRLFLSILFNKGQMYHFFWIEGQKKKKIVRIACVKSYLLYLVGCLLFGDKSNKHIELIYLTIMDDYAGMRNIFGEGWHWHTYTTVYLRSLSLEEKLLEVALHCSW